MERNEVGFILLTISIKFWICIHPHNVFCIFLVRKIIFLVRLLRYNPKEVVDFKFKLHQQQGFNLLSRVGCMNPKTLVSLIYSMSFQRKI